MKTSISPVHQLIVWIKYELKLKSIAKINVLRDRWCIKLCHRFEEKKLGWDVCVKLWVPLLSYINKSSRICSRCQVLPLPTSSDLRKSTGWPDLASNFLQDDELVEVPCSSKQFIKRSCLCLMQEQQGQISS